MEPQLGILRSHPGSASVVGKWDLEGRNRECRGRLLRRRRDPRPGKVGNRSRDGALGRVLALALLETEELLDEAAGVERFVADRAGDVLVLLPLPGSPEPAQELACLRA